MGEVTTSVQIVLSQHCNGCVRPRLFGGVIMSWIDIVGAVAARRYCGYDVTTVCVDNLVFINPAHLNDIIVQEAVITWTGHSSIEVRVESFIEANDEKKLINRAYLVYVALDENEKPTQVKPFVPETKAEKLEYFAALERRRQRLRRE